MDTLEREGDLQIAGDSGAQRLGEGKFLDLIADSSIGEDIRQLAITLEQREMESLEGTVSVSMECSSAMMEMAGMLRDVREVNNRSQAISAAAEEMVASVKEIATTSEAASNDATLVRTTANEGIRSAEKAEVAMANISSAVENAAGQVETLAEASEKIGEIVQSIEAIAKQTNLLALNATIEAARAGEAGKGFAVVAGEVKNLANQTAKATEDIRARIEALRSDMATIVSSMEEGAKAVDEGREVIQTTSNGMRDIASQVEGVTTKMEDVSAILSQQSEASGEVAQGVSVIADMTDRNVTSVNRVVDTMDKADGVIVERLEALIKYQISAGTVEIAKADHIRFMKNLMNAMIGRTVIEPGNLASHTNCRLGKWYYDIAAKDPETKADPAYVALEAPHKKVHDLGHEALEHLGNHDIDAALATMSQCMEASKDVLELLDEVKTHCRSKIGLSA